MAATKGPNLALSKRQQAQAEAQDQGRAGRDHQGDADAPQAGDGVDQQRRIAGQRIDLGHHLHGLDHGGRGRQQLVARVLGVASLGGHQIDQRHRQQRQQAQQHAEAAPGSDIQQATH
jgi:hypothetical protein